MIQLNLLPDVKEKYIKALKQKRLVFGGAFLVIGISIGIVVFLLAIANGAQQIQLNNQSDDIKKLSKELTSTPDLNKILTIQNQLSQLSGLHDKKPVTSRIYDFLPQITPTGVTVSKMSISFEDGTNTITINGTAKNQETINKLVDTLKFTKYTVTGTEDQKNAFSEVVLSSFSIGDKESSYTINLKYDPELFSSKNAEVKLVVPKQITTRSTTERPEAIFKQPENTEGQ